MYSVVLFPNAFLPEYRYILSVPGLNLRKRVSLFTTAPYLLSLGTSIDPLVRQDFTRCAIAKLFVMPMNLEPVGRERLLHLKSVINLRLVKRYRNKHGQPKVKGGPHLTESANYPINLGLKAGSAMGS